MRRRLGKILAMLLVVMTLVVFTYNKYPVSYTRLINQNADKYNVDPYLIAAIINVESGYDKMAKSSKEAKGLMQITPKTGQWASEMIGLQGYSEESLYDPEVNIEIGSWYIDRLYGEFNGDLDLVLAAYNGGSGNVRKWLNNKDYSSDGLGLDHIPFEETRNYLDKVKKSYNIYRSKHRKAFENEDFQGDDYVSFLNGLKKNVKSIILSD